MLRRKTTFAAACFILAASAAVAQETAPENAPTIEAVAVAPATVRIPAGTAVNIELIEALSSRDSVQDQLFGIRLLDPIVVDGRELVPAGVIGGGQVIDAHASGFGGRQGRLIVSGRYLEINGQQVRIRGMQITAAGRDRAGVAMAVSMIPYAGVASIFIQGGEVEIPVGAQGVARLAEDIDVPVGAPADVTPVETDGVEVSSPVEGNEQ